MFRDVPTSMRSSFSAMAMNAPDAPKPPALRQAWCPQRDSNSRPPDYKSDALPAELWGQAIQQNSISA